MIDHKRPSRGFTLPEILIVILIFSFILVVFMGLMTSAKSSWFIAEVQSDLYQNARKGMQEMVRDLLETSSGFCETFTFLDPITGEIAQGVWFASGRGDPDIAGEDASARNDYLHLDANNVASWRAVIVYCPYQDANLTKQLRRYVTYGPSTAHFGGANIFPLTFISATSTTLTFSQANSTLITFNRADGRVLVNYIASEDANNDNALDANEDDGNDSDPVDNADGVLNYGANFTKNVGSLNIILFLRRDVGRMNQSGVTLSSTLTNLVKFRQP